MAEPVTQREVAVAFRVGFLFGGLVGAVVGYYVLAAVSPPRPLDERAPAREDRHHEAEHHHPH